MKRNSIKGIKERIVCDRVSLQVVYHINTRTGFWVKYFHSEGNQPLVYDSAFMAMERADYEKRNH